MSGSIRTAIQAQRVIDDGDMLLYRALPAAGQDALGPFVFLDHYRHSSLRGIGDKPHPHAGIEVLSYIIEGSMEHRDSMGFRDQLGPGDAQWIRAGSGILHAEQPLSGRHGLQLWASLPPDQKFASPSYKSWRSSEIPRIGLPGGHVCVVAGALLDSEGPMRLATATTFAFVHLNEGADIEIPVTSAEFGIYVISGEVLVGSDESHHAGSLLILDEGDHRVSLRTPEHVQADLILLGGARAERPILFSGPFVMDTVEHLAQARRDYASGKMGRLDGTPF